MSIRTRVTNWLIGWSGVPVTSDDPSVQFRQADSVATVTGRTRDTRESLMAPVGSGLMIDPDDPQFQRLSGGQRITRRDLTPVQQDRVLEIAWYLYESNPFAKRLITLMSDLVVGEGITIEAKDDKIQEEIDLMWNHRINQLSTRHRAFHDALCLNGELALPVESNPITGRPILGYIDPYQIQAIVPVPDNVLIPDLMVLKPAKAGEEPKTLRIVRENPDTGQLEGEVFYFTVNNLPNSLRGRSDFLPLADWLDLYDQYLFAEVERLNLLSNFVWDLTMTGASETQIKTRLAQFPTPRPGSVFGHNEKETLEARTPDLKATDRSAVAHMLRVHIAGSMGFPTSYFGDNEGGGGRATIEGQNDILLKTPAARQKQFAGFIDQIVRFTLEGSTTKNRILFKGANLSYRVMMPEIATKDVARVGAVVASVMSAMDTGLANHTMSRQGAITMACAIVKHIGVDLDPQEISKQVDVEMKEDQARQDELQAMVARGRAQQPGQPATGPATRGTPPEPDARMVA